MLIQGAGDWTERQRSLFQGAEARGEERTVLIASDSPHLSRDLIDQAFAALNCVDVVLGPTVDGGYSLIGMRGWHDVLQGVPMSTSTVLAQIVSSTQSQGCSLELLETTFDVDRADDLAELRLAALADPELRDPHPASAAWLARATAGGAFTQSGGSALMNGSARPLALVTGGAGLIGSHISDLLLREGWRVRILDNLEPQTHRNGKPAWVPDDAEFRVGDIRDAATVREALEGVDTVFHEAAYGGYMPDMGKYVHVNSFGTAQMLEIIRDENLPVRKVIVASSQAVYSEGRATARSMGWCSRQHGSPAISGG